MANIVSENSLIAYQYHNNAIIIKLYNNFEIFEINGHIALSGLSLIINNNVNILTTLPVHLQNDVSIIIGTFSRMDLINILKTKAYLKSKAISFHWDATCMQLCEDKLDELLIDEAEDRAKYHASRLISNTLYDAWNNPNNPIGYRHLLREYEKLETINIFIN